MFVLGHLGIGGRLAAPQVPARARRWVFLGTLLPDLIDKPLYYGLSLLTGLHGGELGLISGTRTFGHTALFLLVVWLLSRGRCGAALALGMATHLLLDSFTDLLGLFGAAGPAATGAPNPPTLAAIFYPLLGLRFPIAQFRSLREHALTLTGGYVVAGEVIGGALLLASWWRARKAKQTTNSQDCL